MNTSWWIDGVLIICLAMVAVSFLLINRDRVGRDTKVNLDTFLLTEEKWFRLYPARLIRHAGINAQAVKLYYWFIKCSLAVMLPLTVLEFWRPDWQDAGYLGVTLLGFFLPDAWLRSRRRARQQAIQRSMSYFVDLMVVFLGSGQSLSHAFGRAVEFGLPARDPLAEEVSIVSRELATGRPRHEAFEALSMRTGVTELSRLASVMDLSFRLGTPMAEVLSEEAEALRTEQLARGTEIGNRKSIESMFPMMLVSLPIFLVLVIFPCSGADSLSLHGFYPRTLAKPQGAQPR